MKYKQHSRIPISEIKKAQKKYRKELIQPRTSDGEINPDFLGVYGAKNIRISEHDIKRMERKNPTYARKLARDFKRRRRIK